MASFYFPQFENEPFYRYFDRLGEYVAQCDYCFETWELCLVVYHGMNQETWTIVDFMCGGQFIDTNYLDNWELFRSLANDTLQWDLNIPPPKSNLEIMMEQFIETTKHAMNSKVFVLNDNDNDFVECCGFVHDDDVIMPIDSSSLKHDENDFSMPMLENNEMSTNVDAFVLPCELVPNNLNVSSLDNVIAPIDPPSLKYVVCEFSSIGGGVYVFEDDVNDMCLKELAGYVSSNENLRNVTCVDNDDIEESSCEVYDVSDEPYDEEFVGIYGTFDIEWNENFVLEEIEKPNSCLKDACILYLDDEESEFETSPMIVSDEFVGFSLNKTYENPTFEELSGLIIMENPLFDDMVDEVTSEMNYVLSDEDCLEESDIFIDSCDNESIHTFDDSLEVKWDDDVFDVDFLGVPTLERFLEEVFVTIPLIGDDSLIPITLPPLDFLTPSYEFMIEEECDNLSEKVVVTPYLTCDGCSYVGNCPIIVPFDHLPPIKEELFYIVNFELDMENDQKWQKFMNLSYYDKVKAMSGLVYRLWDPG